ncbi:C-terminal domain of 1-Cys peroxiredoxin [Paenibacillus sp. yr247]|nr:C-terminal domain of 1-Cys peroxiredoxin [Paenibacillus sp. yr247]
MAETEHNTAYCHQLGWQFNHGKPGVIRFAAHRGLFIIDPEGILRYQVITDMNVGLSVDETLRVLQALQAGGLCPANWKPGDKTL